MNKLLKMIGLMWVKDANKHKDKLGEKIKALESRVKSQKEQINNMIKEAY